MKLLKSQDLFSEPIKFNFNRKDSDHKTGFGGAISVLIKIFMIFYTALLLKKLYLFEDDKNKTFIEVG